MSTVENFVVAIVEDGEIRRYYAEDEGGGGYPLFPTSLSRAKIFENEDYAYEVVERLGKLSDRKPDRMSDETLHPHIDISNALKISCEKPIAAGEAVVMLIDFRVRLKVAIYGEIKQSTENGCE